MHTNYVLYITQINILFMYTLKMNNCLVQQNNNGYNISN